MFGSFARNRTETGIPGDTPGNGTGSASFLTEPETEAVPSPQPPADENPGNAVPFSASAEPLTIKFSSLLSDDGVSDIHVVVKGSIGWGIKMSGWARINGILVEIPLFVDDAEDKLIERIIRKTEELEEIADGSMTLSNGKRLRISIRTVLEGRKREIFFRVLPKDIPPVIHSLSDILSPVMTPSSGIFIVSGVTGSGKSTLLASVAQNYLDTCGTHIVTIEDPIEYIFRSTGCGYASQRDVGVDVKSFADGVKKSLREDPDVILVGEVRDSETALAALTAAETGHMVLATVHAPGCFGAVDRYLAMLGSDDYQAMRFSHAYLGGVHIESVPAMDGSGIRRTYEAFFNNDASRTHIRERKTHQLGQARNVILKKTL